MPEWLAWGLAITAVIGVPWASVRLLHRYGWRIWLAIVIGVLAVGYVADAIQKRHRQSNKSN